MNYKEYDRIERAAYAIWYEKQRPADERYKATVREATARFLRIREPDYTGYNHAVLNAMQIYGSETVQFWDEYLVIEQPAWESWKQWAKESGQLPLSIDPQTLQIIYS